VKSCVRSTIGDEWLSNFSQTCASRLGYGNWWML
jgi:hypothetical protein